jgi:hypothetical protein
MIEIPTKGSPWAHLNPAQLKEALNQLKAAIGNGSLDCAYSKTGGGGYIVVNVDDHEQLHRALRMLTIHDANVVPISALTDVIQGYIDHHESGDHQKHQQKVKDHLKRYSIK